MNAMGPGIDARAPSPLVGEGRGGGLPEQGEQGRLPAPRPGAGNHRAARATPGRRAPSPLVGEGWGGGLGRAPAQGDGQ